MVPSERIAAANRAPLRGDGDFVLYWMIAHRRPVWNHALDHAIAHATALGKPLLVCEYLRSGHQHSCDRLHQLMVAGMADNRAAFAKSCVHYLPYVEALPGDGDRFLAALLARACLVITDQFPSYLHPRMVADLAGRSPVLMEAVDANGLLPLTASPAAPARAVDFRRFLQKQLPAHLGRGPEPKPLRGLRLPRLADDALPSGADIDSLLAGGISRLPLDHAVGPVALRGGWKAAQACLERFLDQRLDRYPERNRVETDAASRLSPYLHLGHISAHAVVQALLDRDEWTPDRLGSATRGAKEGWWGLPAASEGFLDQIVTWRELGYHFCHHRPDHDRYAGLPTWALATLDAHRLDPRTYVYSREDLESARTHDPIWNAAQRQLRGEGVIHNYLRMLWGKKILEWSPTPEAAWDHLAHLNNRWAIDGCNPNSWTGIAWCFGRFDRPWAPQRPVFGSIRWMSSDCTRRKMDLSGYLAHWAG